MPVPKAAPRHLLAKVQGSLVERIGQFKWQNVGFYPWLRTVALRVTDSGGNTAIATLPFVVIGVPVSGLPVDPPPVGAPPVQGPLPAAAITAEPAPALGAATTRFTVTCVGYAGIDASTFDGLDVRVVGPHGYDRTASFVSGVRRSLDAKLSPLRVDSRKPISFILSSSAIVSRRPSTW